MKSTIYLSIVIIICAALICGTILFTNFSHRDIQWQYQVASYPLDDGKWLKGFGDNGWEVVMSTTDKYDNVKVLFKKQK